MRTAPSNQPNSTKVNLWVDAALFAAIMLALSPVLTGIAIHEWLSVALAAAVVVHLLLHWRWIVAVVRRFLGRLAGQSRLNFVLNIALFINFSVVTFTGLMISRVALPAIGLVTAESQAWQVLHSLSADLILFIAGLHVALHWKWIFSALKRYVIAPIAGAGCKPAPRWHAAAVPVVRQEAGR